jgi:3-isopropylmalate dehydratase small subunit
MDQVCRIISFSLEQGNFICKKLKEIGVVDVVEGGFGTRLFIKNHLKIEEIPKTQKKDTLEESLKAFQNSKKDFTQKIESFQAKQAKKQKDLFAELEEKLKKGSDK